MKDILKQFFLTMFLYLLITDNIIGQTTNTSFNSVDSLNIQSNRIPNPPILYYIDLNNDGHYENVQLTEELIPFIGNEMFFKKLTQSIKYPALAIEYGIEGNVILDIFVDELGKIKNISIQHGFSKDCDEEAKKGMGRATQNGYAILIIDSKPVKYKMEYPIKFRLK